jgi:hypothetical protein
MGIPDSLDYFLGKCYEHDVIRRIAPKEMIDALRKRMDANQNLKAEAQKRLAGLTDAVTKKCFISKKHKEFLTEALGPNSGA